MENFIWLIIIVIAYFLFIKPIIDNFESKRNKKMEEQEDKRIPTEDEVYNRQNKFEERIEKHYLPDTLPGKQIYIYKKLMLYWYNKISGESRYKEDIINKIRKDWVDYMYHLENASECNYLSLEANDEKISEEYRKEHIDAVKKAMAIEDAFASMVGEVAKKELEEIRKIDDWGTFNEKGEKAPKGFRYDLRGNFVKNKYMENNKKI